MKVIILAAGSGRRFKALNLPKPLTMLANGKSILDMQLSALSTCVPIDDVILVVGYRKEKIMELYPDHMYIYNPNFASENTAKSLLRALNKVNEDVLWLNGDVVFHPAILSHILSIRKNGMVVNHASVGEEEVKYRTDKDGRILEISKEVSNPEGEALGINFFTKMDLPALKLNLQKCHDTDYFEKAIELSIEQGINVWGVPIDPLPCVEIDFPDDLKKANSLLSEISL